MIDSIFRKYNNSFEIGVKIIISTYELISLYKEKILKNKFKAINESMEIYKKKFKIS
tara:strand:+ start:87 stop:257 length:171 start_codon:yes stop_codon:yes gene_type:complete